MTPAPNLPVTSGTAVIPAKAGTHKTGPILAPGHFVIPAQAGTPKRQSGRLCGSRVMPRPFRHRADLPTLQCVIHGTQTGELLPTLSTKRQVLVIVLPFVIRQPVVQIVDDQGGCQFTTHGLFSNTSLSFLSAA